MKQSYFLRLKLAIIIIQLITSLIIGGCSSGSAEYQGYVEGEFLYLAASQSGRLILLPVNYGDKVEEGGLIFELDATLDANKVKQAEAEYNSARDSLADLRRGLRPTEIEALKAQVAEAKAAMENSSSNFRRSEALFKNKSISKANFDADKSLADADMARVKQLENKLATALLPTGREEQIRSQAGKVDALAAVLAQTRWYLSEKTILAPQTGVVHDVFFRVGEWVPAGTPVVKFLPPENIKIRFFVPEKEFSRLSLGQEVRIKIDSFQEYLPALITYLAPEAEFTPPVIYSNETRDKLVFMVEARLREISRPLNPGQPVVVEAPVAGGGL